MVCVILDNLAFIEIQMNNQWIKIQMNKQWFCMCAAARCLGSGAHHATCRITEPPIAVWFVQMQQAAGTLGYTDTLISPMSK